MSLEPVLVELTAFVTTTRAAVKQLAQVATSAVNVAEPKRSDLSELEPLVAQILGSSEEMLHGAGFVAAPGLLADAPWWLEWFAWDGQRIQRLVPETNPEGTHFFDYTLMPWFSGPQSGRGPTTTGPYVDYLCTDDYTLTFTEAVFDSRGDFAGVVGADVRVLALEQQFLKLLRSSPELLVVVNDFGRVVLSNSAKLLSGTLLDNVELGTPYDDQSPRFHRVAGSELALVELGPRSPVRH